MAINPNFVFTDPVAARQAVQMAEMLARERAEKDRNAAMLAQETTRQATARENAAQQMNQQSNEARLTREARATETDKILKSQETVAGINADRYKDVNKGRDETQQFNLIQQDIDAGDPPTDSEFEARTAGMSQQLKNTLNNRRADKIREMNSLADLGDAAAVGYSKQLVQGAKLDDVNKAINQSFHKGSLVYNPQKKVFQSLYRRPRVDAFNPQARGTGQSFGPPAPVVTPIGEIRARVTGETMGPPAPTASTGFVPRASELAGPPAPPTARATGEEFGPFVTPAPPRSTGETMGPPAPPTQSALSGSGRFVPLDARFDEPVGGFTGGEKFLNFGSRLVESRQDAAERRLNVIRRTHPGARLVVRGGTRDPITGDYYPESYFVDLNPPLPAPEYLSTDLPPARVGTIPPPPLSSWDFSVPSVSVQPVPSPGFIPRQTDFAVP